MQIICAIFWWNPLIYLLKHDINNTLEIKSDLSITNNMTEDKKLEYLQSILLITLMSFLFVSSYFIVLQPDGGPPAEYTSGLVFDIDIDNTFLRMNPDGTYSVYENDIFIGTINNADEEPFSSFQILETTEE